MVKGILISIFSILIISISTLSFNLFSSKILGFLSKWPKDSRPEIFLALVFVVISLLVLGLIICIYELISKSKQLSELKAKSIKSISELKLLAKQKISELNQLDFTERLQRVENVLVSSSNPKIVSGIKPPQKPS